MVKVMQLTSKSLVFLKVTFNSGAYGTKHLDTTETTSASSIIHKCFISHANGSSFSSFINYLLQIFASWTSYILKQTQFVDFVNHYILIVMGDS